MGPGARVEQARTRLGGGRTATNVRPTRFRSYWLARVFKKSSRGALPQRKCVRSCDWSNGSTTQSSMTTLVLGSTTPECVVRLGRVFEQCEEGVSIPVRKRSEGLLVELHVVFRNRSRFANAQLRVADRFD